jgi:hypothetical protein
MSSISDILVTKQKKQAQEEDSHVIVRAGIRAKCPGMIGSINTEMSSLNLAHRLCSLHIKPLNEEREQSFNVRMTGTTWLRPLKP